MKSMYQKINRTLIFQNKILIIHYNFSVDELAFGEAQYEGSIIDNQLQLSPLVLTQGYEEGFSVNIIGGYYHNINFYH